MAAALTGPAYNAKFDANRTPSLTAISGTAGTSDTTGTAEVIRLSANPATGAQYVEDLSGASGTTNVSVLNGTLQNSGTTTGVGVVSNLTNGSVNILTGTVTRISNIGTLEVGTVSIGSIANVGVIHNAGSIAALPQVSVGTLPTLNLTTGTINSGTVVGPVASGGSETGAPVPIGGTDSGGTVRLPLVDSSGFLRTVIVDTGGQIAGVSTDALAIDIARLNGGGAAGQQTMVNSLGVVIASDQSVLPISGTMQVGTITTGSLTNIAQIHNAGTLAAGDNNIGNVDIVTGTVTSITNLVGGTIGSVLGIGGTVTVTGGGGGTQFAEDAIHSSGAGGNLLLTVRTDGGTALAADGDYHVLETDANGALRIAGTVATGAGTQAVRIIDGTTTLVTTVSNLTNGSVNILTGTIQNSGTTTGVGTVSNIGVIHNAGTIAAIPQVSVGTLSDLPGGTLDLGTVVGANTSGGTSTTNPLQIGGTTSTGTVYGMLVDTAGNPQVDVITIPQVSVGTIPQVSVGTLPTLNLTTGTITTGSLTNIAQIHNAGTLAAGANNIGDMDIATGTVTLVSTLTTLSNLTNGSVNILTGTLQSSGTTTGVGVVSNLTNGSINILTGTLQSSGTTTGVGVVSNLTNGSVNILTGTLTSVTNLAAGTVQVNPVPIPTMLTFGTLGTAGGSFFATISGASGAGTKHYVAGVDVIMDSGTADVRVLAGSAIQGTGVLGAGKFPPGGGISKRFTPVFATGTNSELIYHFVGAGTAFITVQYWQAA